MKSEKKVREAIEDPLQISTLTWAQVENPNQLTPAKVLIRKTLQWVLQKEQGSLKDLVEKN